jgi:hypothetical protein
MPFGGPYKKNVSADRPVVLYVCMFLYLFFIPFFFLGCKSQRTIYTEHIPRVRRKAVHKIPSYKHAMNISVPSGKFLYGPQPLH